jgi:hypothetical protein
MLKNFLNVQPFGTKSTRNVSSLNETHTIPLFLHFVNSCFSLYNKFGLCYHQRVECGLFNLVFQRQLLHQDEPPTLSGQSESSS